MAEVKTVAPGQSGPEQAITLLRDAALQLGGATRNPAAQSVAKRIYNYLAAFPTHFVVEYLVKVGDRCRVHRVALSDWPDWGLPIARELGVVDAGGHAPPIMVGHPTAPDLVMPRLRPLSWDDGDTESTCAKGFHLEHAPDDADDPTEPWRLVWGEGEPDYFATRELAKADADRQWSEFVADQLEPGPVTPERLEDLAAEQHFGLVADDQAQRDLERIADALGFLVELPSTDALLARIAELKRRAGAQDGGQ